MINFATIYSSVKPLKGAFGGIADSSVVVAHLPGFGVVLSAHEYGDSNLREIAERMKGILFGLVGLTKGLSSNEVVCLAFHQDDGDDQDMVVVQMRPGAPETLKVFFNGSTSAQS